MRARPDNAVQPEGAGQADPAGSSANPSEPATGIYLIEPPSRELGDKFPRLPRVGIWEHHLPENRILISDGVCQIVGVDPEFCRDNPGFWSDAVHPRDAERLRETYARFIEGGEPELEVRYRVRHTGGQWMSVLARARWERRDGPGRGLVRGYVMDVTWSERMRLQAEILERIGEGVLMVSRDGIIHFVNAVFENTMGYTPGEMPGQHARVLSFRSRESFDGLLTTVFEATENGSSAVIDLEGRRRDGSMVPLQGRFSSLRIDGAPHVVAVFSDISARKQLEREMMQVATRVQQRVGGDLHEGLGQQLSGIAMMLQGLRDRVSAGPDAGLAAELDEVVSLLNGAIARTRLLARGLSPVRPSAEGIKEGFEELVNNVYDVYGLRVRLRLELPDDLTVDENPVTNMFHIAQEAVANAARHAGAREIHLTFRVSGPDLELQVEDDGVGFDPVHASQAGMGMRMMRFRAEMARGFLSIESRPGHGARLRCRCPARTEKPA
jgi:PAS domain S-box-containing protein|nr:MAG: hypothetical protein DIU62_04930 [Pseudomonadota bacterium]